MGSAISSLATGAANIICETPIFGHGANDENNSTHNKKWLHRSRNLDLLAGASTDN